MVRHPDLRREAAVHASAVVWLTLAMKRGELRW
jgi:hypothetical protein